MSYKIKRTTLWLYYEITQIMIQLLKEEGTTLSEWVREQQLNYIEKKLQDEK